MERRSSEYSSDLRAPLVHSSLAFPERSSRRVGVGRALCWLLARRLASAAESVIAAIDHAEEIWDEPGEPDLALMSRS